MAKIDPKKWPSLKKAWDEYGHAVAFEDLDGLKTDSRGNYVVVRWKEKDGPGVGMADLARAGADHPWEMQNDGMDEITEADWRKLEIVPDCDWFRIPGHPEYGDR